MRELGHEVYGEPPEDVHCINDHPCGWQELRHKYTGEPPFLLEVINEK